MFSYLQIETTTFCNASCYFCPSNQIPNNQMPISLFKKIIDSTRNMSVTYRPYGLGEPLIDPRLEEMLSYIKQDVTAKIELHSNGEPLSQKIENIVAKYCDTIRFSIDGFSEATVSSVRKINRDKVYNNVSRFIKNNSSINIQVRLIDLESNKHEQQQFIDYWNDLRNDCVVITKLYEHPWESQTSSTKDSCKKCQDEAFIYVDGSVHPCPWDFGNRHLIGNVIDTSIVTLWKQEQYKKFRKALSKGNRSQFNLCKRCNYKE